jgi:hypothetical protein
MTKGLIGLTLGSMLVGGTALAQTTDTPAIDQRIQEGINSGQLTDQEADRMNRHLDRIENAESKAKTDGQVTKMERRRLNRKLNHSSRAIHRQKHDRQHQ